MRPSASQAAVAPAAGLAARWLLALLVATTLLVLPPTVAEPAHAAADEVVLAVEGPLGPEPQDRLDPDNAARELAGYEDMDIMFTWGASFLLLGLVVTLLVVAGALWYLLVLRPEKRAAEQA